LQKLLIEMEEKKEEYNEKDHFLNQGETVVEI
jgi:hypothetical protein